MKYSILLIFVSIICFASCHQQETDHLPAQKMQQILLDVSTAEAYSIVMPKDSTKKTSDKNEDSLAVFYKRILKHYNISQAEFDKSMDWYKKHPDELDTIYTKMIPEMTKLDTSKKD